MALFDRDDASGIIQIRCIMCGRDICKIDKFEKKPLLPDLFHNLFQQ